MITGQDIDKIIQQVVIAISLKHSEMLAPAILTYFKSGSDDVNKSKWTKQQQAAVDKLTAEHFGYISEFNRNVGEQIKERARDILRANGGYEEIEKELRPYVEKIFEGKEQVVIDNRGKFRTEIKLSKDGKLYKEEIEIKNVYRTNTKAYSEMVSQTATHTAWEQGRASQYQKLSKYFRIIGPTDERARPWHVAVIGIIFEYNTEQGNLALQLLEEPNCRHRQEVVFNNEYDTPQEYYDKQKEKAGVYWDESKGDWSIKDVSI